ncbi:MAG: diaminopimelate decarboxylase [Pseudomonadales bacterium]|nr:diaminopimelate decarboxylase [Pseudomonadales bacterium]
MNDVFHYQDQQLFTEQLAVSKLAEQYGTPCYLYSRAMFTKSYQAFANALGDYPGMICYAVKANSNIAVLNLLARLGSGFDIVSGGELQRVLTAGGDPARIVFSGVGKTADEMKMALEAGIFCFNVESEAELHLLNQTAAETDCIAPVSFRVNPDVDAKTHPYISTGLKENKFGIAIQDALRVYQLAAAMPHVHLQGVDCHIGSQLTEMEPFMDALEKVLALVDQLKQSGIELAHIDMGGGLGVRYQDEQPISAGTYISALIERISEYGLELMLEPGRAIAANSGILVTRVQYLKNNEDKSFAIVDAAMNDLIRPTLYSAWQDIIPVDKSNSEQIENPRISSIYDIVGPICETGDFLGTDRQLSLRQGELLAICSAGAYGFTMSSNYNSRNRCAEVMVDGEQSHLIRARETFEMQIAGEARLPED